MPIGTSTINFGAFPGAPDTSVTVVGQFNIVATSLVEAWISPATTADHSSDEHWVDPPRVVAGNIVPGVGFTIYGTSRVDRPVPDTYLTQGQIDPNYIDMPYGAWNFAW